MKDLQGKLALVTGGARGVGRVIVDGLAARGAHVLVNYFHSHESAKQCKSELEAKGATVDILRASVALRSQVDRMFDEIEERFGHLDILVNNAASGAFVATAEIEEEHFARAFNTNLQGPFWCSRRAAQLMKTVSGGCIVNVSSIGAGLAPANYLVVGTSKAALEALTRYLAVEFAPWNIRVNTASASMIDGDVARLFPEYESMRRNSIANTPLSRIATPEDLAGVVLFLCGSESMWVTGQTILADGGLSLSSAALSPDRAPRQLKDQAQPVTGKCDVSPHELVIDSLGDDDEQIAIVGMGIAVAGANSPDEFWDLSMKGPELFSNVPEDRWDYRSFYSPDSDAEDKSYQTKSVFITDFRPVAGTNSNSANRPAEYTTGWLRHSLIQALASVKQQPNQRASFVVGYTPDGSQHLEEAMVLNGALERFRRALVESGASDREIDSGLREIRETLTARYWRGSGDAEQFLPHNVGFNAMEGVLPADAELVIVDTACSSSLYAIDIGIKGLLMGKHDLAACGGAFALAPRGSVLFSKLHGLSVSGEVRPLDANCDGVLFSDGAGVVVLKKLKKALQDGDEILALIRGFGSSSDGKGKAIYAPNPAGQGIAIDRAFEHTNAHLNHVDWVVAHATGTPAGDLAEVTTLCEKIKSERPVYLTSNKSLIGHTGWAAGVASLIQAVLGLKHHTIPPQHRFSVASPDLHIENSSLRIPESPVPWPPNSDRPRAVSISGFGFGGTNAHMVIEDYTRAQTCPPRIRQWRERLAIVGWSAHLPGLTGREQIARWALDGGVQPDVSFGDTYPLPPVNKVRMPPGLLRTIDRCQLMVLESAHELKEQLEEFWQANSNEIGVIIGHMGPTRNASLYAVRCYLDDIVGALGNLAVQRPALSNAIGIFRSSVKNSVPASNENSFPGMMPNVIPARIANYFGLRGLNMTIDTGYTSAATAVDIAGRYLRSGELKMALVGAINGNSTPELTALLPESDRRVAEGAFLFALATESVAKTSGLPVLAYVDSDNSAEPATVKEISRDSSRANYLGAEAAIGLLRACQNGSGETRVTCQNSTPQSSRTLTVRSAEADRPPAQPAQIPAMYLSSSATGAGVAPEVDRYVVALEPVALTPVRESVSFVPPNCVILTNQVGIVSQLAGLRPDSVVICTEAGVGKRPNCHFISEANAQSLASVLPPANAIRHVRVVSNLTASTAPEKSLSSIDPSLTVLHELTFLALQFAFSSLSLDGSSFISVFPDSVVNGVIHPSGGLFSGLTKSAALELPGCITAAVFTTQKDLASTVAQAEAESSARQLLPVVVYESGVRKTIRVTKAGGEFEADNTARIQRDSTIVAVGGARGITAELLKTIAEHFQPQIFLIGSNKLDGYAADIYAASEGDFAKRRASFIRGQKSADPQKSLAAINREFDRMLDARTARKNIEFMRKFCGPDRVHYLACDVLDEDAVASAMKEIISRAGKIDLLIHAAGINRSSAIPQKSLRDFQAVRDLKLRGYQNLKRALSSSAPRMWCNFGSFIGLTGQLGETDYASANDYLASAAAYARTAGEDEFTIGWTLWGNVGLGSNPVTKAFLEKSGLFTSMTTPTGIYHFVREVNLANHAAFTVHLGNAERKAITDHVPEFFATVPCTSSPVPKGTFYVGRKLAQTGEEVMIERVFDSGKDGYLSHHVVNGYATLPGTFVPELAAEAAIQLFPNLKVIGFENASFDHFLRVYDATRPSTKKIHARVARSERDYKIVHVKVLTDVLSSGGIVLKKDKLHFSIDVVLASDYPPASHWEAWPKSRATFVPDPYHFPKAPVCLTGCFVSTRDTCAHPLGKMATFDLKVDAGDPVFSSFLVPSILLDGLARVAVLNYVNGSYVPLAAPAFIRRIDLYEAGNDRELADRYQDIRLYVTPRQFSLDDAQPENRFVAVRPDGTMLMQMKDVRGVVLGYVHGETGEFSPTASDDHKANAAVGQTR